jgi:hypothetical protein
MSDHPDHRREQEGKEDRVRLDPSDEIYEMFHNGIEYT